MNQKQIRAAVEAMLFASGDPIGADKLAQAVQLPQLSVEVALEINGRKAGLLIDHHPDDLTDILTPRLGGNP